MPERPKRSLRTRLLAAVLAPLVFLLLLEGGLRLFGYTWSPTEKLAGQAELKELTQPDMYRPHPRWLWTLKPDTTIHNPSAGMVSTATNSEGFRRPEFPAEKDAGEFRVLCLGDSVTFGLGLRERETYPARLQSELQRFAGNRLRVRVINAGVPGWSSLSAARFLEDHRALDPDVIVFWFGMNDAKEALGAPDSRVRGESGTGGTGGGLRTMQLLGRILSGLRRTRTRVSPEEYTAAMGEAAASAPHALIVRYPEQLDVVIGQLETVLARAEAEGVDRVVGPRVLLSPFSAVWPGADLTGTRITTDDGPALRFSGDGTILDMPLSILRSDLSRLTGLTVRFRGLMALTPEGSPGYAEIFGDVPPDTVFHDSCHMNVAGAARAGKALAEWMRPWLADRIRGE